MSRETFFIGSYTIADDWIPNAGGEGISALELDLETGRLEHGGVRARIDSPSYLARSPDGRMLAACSELFHGDGFVSTFAVGDAEELRLLSRRTSLGRATCHVAVDARRGRVLAASYLDGRAVSYDLENGRLAETPVALEFAGTGPKSDRQESSHPHHVVLYGDAYLIPDLGADRIWVHAAGDLTEPPEDAIETPPGYGPRHLLVHPELAVLYVVCELEPRVLMYERGGDADPEGWNLAGDHACEQPGRIAEAAPAAIKLHPSGRSLTVSNRFSDSLQQFSVDPASGRLVPAGNTRLAGKTPRDFGFSRDGRWLLALCQDSHEVFSYATDPATGEMVEKPTGRLEMGSPVCIV
jgi:6-phosphogluconolactonase